ncbi:hypothetical protein AXE65_00980 [Ventosimonas gracilis]|uniref:histidine kinase n=1 Tax=Ventosimonas gracilis TaxID=1680762 RepID=A0A139SVV3_9GAMM|nr:ATP-binding protein [Ventosimonas gracilis]KXU38582.1 hypothetical protein AXE65_00980 [Ventosimonas gracilis]
MTTNQSTNIRAQSTWNWVLTASVMAGIFLVDTITSLEIAIAVFYAIVILTAARTLARPTLIALAVCCCCLTLLSFFLSTSGDWRSGLVNLLISISAISMSAWLVLRLDAARSAAHAAQTQLTRLARAHSLSGLSAALAHEVNQPLAAIVTSGDACQRWLTREPPDLGRARDALARIRSDAERASQIIARMRSLARGEAPRPRAFDLSYAVNEVIALLGSALARHRIRTDIQFAPGLPDAYADRIQVQQVAINLLTNAIDAMTSTPTRHLRVVCTDHDDQLVVAVSDTGSGIPPDMLAHLFTPFYTTKAGSEQPESAGMGVGLSISRTLIEANGGQLWAQSAPAGGASFQFSVPIARSKP